MKLIVPFVAVLGTVGTTGVFTANSAWALTPPTVSGVSPLFGPPSGGTTVTISGTNFTGATVVDFSSTAATSLTVNSATSITAVSPAGTAGTVNVTVTTSQGTSSTSPADQFTYVASPTVYTPPTSTIPANCSTDIGDVDYSLSTGNGLLYNWLESLPSGTPSHPIVVRFVHNGCYLDNGGLYLRNFRDVVFDGNGATFKQVTTPADAPVLYNFDTPTTAYCGDSTSYGHADTYVGAAPILFWFDGGCDIVVENMTIQGPYTGSGGGGAAAENSGIQFSGVQRAVVTNDTIEDVSGDFVTMSGLWEPGIVESDSPSTDVTITDNTFNTAGRQGVTGIYVDRILVSHNTITSVADTIFDIEADVAGYGDSDNIDITNNTISGQLYGWLVSALTGTGMNNFAFTNNQMTDGAEIRMDFDPEGLNNATITGNVATGADGSSDFGRPPIFFDDESNGNSEPETNLLVANNTIPSTAWNTSSESGPGEPTVIADGAASNLQVRNNYMPYTPEPGVVPSTYTRVLPLYQWAAPPTLYGSPPNQACGNTQGSSGGPIYYGSACTTSVSPPTLPTSPTSPNDFPSASLASVGSVSGSVYLDAGASSNFGIVSVQYQLTGGLFGATLHTIATATPTLYGYLAGWDTTTVPDGTYALQAVATDATGDNSLSAPATITVNNGTQPVTSIATPSAGATLNGTELIGAAASDSGSTVTSVQFEVTGAGFTNDTIGTGTATYYGYLFEWDTTTAPDGTYELQSIATDAAGNTKTSTGISITVDNNAPPTTSVIMPSSGGSVSGSSVGLDAVATSSFGISSVEFLISGGSLTNDVIATGTPTYFGYAALWNSETVPDGTYTLQSLAYDDAANPALSAGITIHVTN